MPPKISIITPSFNQAVYLERTILSVIKQNYENLEYIIIDGGSTDGSVDIIRKYEKQLAYWISEKDEGQSAAINKGFIMATGEICGWINSDDILLPNSLNTIVEFFIKNPDIDSAYGNFIMIDKYDNVLRKIRIYNNLTLTQLAHHDYIGQPALFFTKDILKKIGYIDEKFHFVMDWDLVIRLKCFSKMVHIDSYLAASRLYIEMKTSSEGSIKYLDELKKLRNKHVEKFNKSTFSFSTKIIQTFIRAFAVIRNGIFSYVKVISVSRDKNIKSVLKFILWRLKY